VGNSATPAGSSIETDKIFGKGRLELKTDTTNMVITSGINYLCVQNQLTEREHSTSVTTIGFSSRSAAIEMTAWLFSLPATKDPSTLPKTASSIDRHWEPAV
jgi:hypothetical protein